MEIEIKSIGKGFISCDWLSVWGTYEPIKLGYGVEFGEEHSQSAQWCDIRPVLLHGRPYGILAHTPKSDLLGKNVASFKVENSLLYQETWYSSMCDLWRKIGFKPVSVSRADICIDFHKFDNGWTPMRLIKAFLNESVVKVGASKWRTMGDCRKGIQPQYLAFGSRSSIVFTRLYNKSLEMREEHVKPWILECWEKNGFDLTKDVWRLEFQCSGKDFKFADVTTGEEILLQPAHLDIPARLAYLVQQLTAKYFEFRTPDGGKNVSRYPRVPLAESTHYTMKRLYVTSLEKLGVREKILIKALWEYEARYCTYRENHLAAADELMHYLIAKGHFGDWFTKHVELWKQRPHKPSFWMMQPKPTPDPKAEDCLNLFKEFLNTELKS